MSIIEQEAQRQVDREKAKAYDSTQKEQHERGLANTAMRKGIRIGSYAGMNIPALDVELGPSAGQIAAREGMQRAWDAEDVLSAQFEEQVPYGGVWSPEVGAMETAIYANSPSGWRADADAANQAQADSLAGQAYIGQQNAIKELVNRGSTPEEAAARLAQIR